MKLSVTKLETIDKNTYVVLVDDKRIWADREVASPIALSAIDDLIYDLFGIKCDARNNALYLGDKKIEVEVEISEIKNPSAEEVFDLYREVLIASADAIKNAKFQSNFEGTFDLP